MHLLLLDHSVPFYTQFGLIRNNVSSGMTKSCIYTCCLESVWEST